MNLFDKTAPDATRTPLAHAPEPIWGRIDFDADRLAAGLVLEVPEVIAFFRDGRRSQPIIERRLLRSFGRNGWRSVATCGGGRRLELATGGAAIEVSLFDVRVVVRELSFAPSWMKGTGRHFDPLAFKNYYRVLAGVFVCDVSAFPLCPYWRVPSVRVIEWADAGLLGARGRVDREDLPRLLEGFEP